MKHLPAIAAIVLATSLAGCTTVPAEYAAGLSTKDRKWNSPACRKMRAMAATYEARERKLYWSAGALVGPYGLGIVAAGKEHQEKMRRQFVRDLHQKCSRQPLPANLQPRPKP